MLSVTAALYERGKGKERGLQKGYSQPGPGRKAADDLEQIVEDPSSHLESVTLTTPHFNRATNLASQWMPG